MVEAFSRHWGNHSSSKVGVINHLGYPTFTANHFNGPMTYSSKGFLDHNLDSLNPDFILLSPKLLLLQMAQKELDQLIPSSRVSSLAKLL